MIKESVPRKMTVGEKAKQEQEVTDHQRLVDEKLGKVAPARNVRVPLYPAPERLGRPRIPNPPAANTATHEVFAQGILTLDTLSTERNRAEELGCFNMEVLSTHENAQVLSDCGFALCGIVGKNVDGQCVQFGRWRLNIRRSSDGVVSVELPN